MDISLLKQLKERAPASKVQELFRKLNERYPGGSDPWGLDLKRSKKILQYVYPLYKNYFKTQVFGLENVPQNQNFMGIGNHSGQIALDGMLTAFALAWELDPPILLRPMVERFMTALPFVNLISSQAGAVLGDRKICLSLLQRGESILAYPEGAKGVAKSTSEYYQLQKFTHGFYRMALQAQVPILPIAVIGAEEIFPYVYHPKKIIKALSLPGLPLSPLYLPLPSPIDIYVGPPIPVNPDLDPECPDKDLVIHVQHIKDTIHEMIQTGLKKRRPYYFNQKQTHARATQN